NYQSKYSKVLQQVSKSYFRPEQILIILINKSVLQRIFRNSLFPYLFHNGQRLFCHPGCQPYKHIIQPADISKRKGDRFNWLISPLEMEIFQNSYNSPVETHEPEILANRITNAHNFCHFLIDQEITRRVPCH